jgi:hypothetical protein
MTSARAAMSGKRIQLLPNTAASLFSLFEVELCTQLSENGDGPIELLARLALLAYAEQMRQIRV